MICPACNTEFPHGTVFCSRCHVTLVADVAEADEMVEKAYPGSALVQLWRGEDAALHASILEALAEANIPFYEQPLGSGPSARPIDQLLDHAHPRFGFEVAVLSSNLAEAEVILEKLLNEGPVDMALAADEEAAQAAPKAKSPAMGVATCEVSVVTAIRDLAVEIASASALATCLEFAASAADAARLELRSLELVWTGPESARAR